MSQEIESYKDTLGQPDVIRESWTLAAKISDTDFVPKAFRKKPEAVMAALLTGRELGLGPMTALQRIHVIEGKAGLDAQGMRALALSHGHDLWIIESTPEKCTVGGRRRGSEHEQTVTWTIQEARTAGLAGKGNWKGYPRQMLQARATAEMCRLIAADALGGMAYSSEELEDEKPAVITRATRATAASTAPADVVTVTTTPAIAPAAPRTAPEASWDDDVADAEVIDPPAAPDELAPTSSTLNGPRSVRHEWDRPATDNDTPDDNLATSNQVRKLSAIFGGNGWDDAAIDAYILNITGGRTDSRKQMTKQEASAAIEELMAQ